MIGLTKEEIQSRLKVEKESNLWFGKLDVFIVGFGGNVEVDIALSGNSAELTDRTIQIINDIAKLTRLHYEYMLKLLFEDAMHMKGVVAWNEPSPPSEEPPTNWLRRVFWRPPKYRFVELADDDPRHPLFGINSPKDIVSRIKWDYFYIDDTMEVSTRFAFLTCHPPWEEEHGREIAIRDGIPIGIQEIQFNEYHYKDF